MLFNSIQFLIFFPLVCTTYFLLPFRFRWVLLLAASYVFYGWWNPAYLLLILLSTGIDYAMGLAMGSTQHRRLRIACLVASLTVNLGLLFTFKYYNFFQTSLAMIGESWGIDYTPSSLDVLLPVGISFYTFQTLSYTIEVFKGTHPPQRHLGIFALYVAFFPQLVAGPIERSSRLLPQFFRKNRFDYDRVVSGLRLMLWGLFKKVVIADRLALIVNEVYSNNQYAMGPLVVFGTICFAYQIYCDFSGYTDIAIGAARVLGFDLMTNFNRPYHAKNIAEFWQRWHISLSTWFRDYVYLPLGGNRVTHARWIFNILTVFIVSGLWHGANWTFLVWGSIHGIAYLLSTLIGKALSPWRDRRFLGGGGSIVWNLLRTLTTFAVVCVSWIFFRAETLPQALSLLLDIGNGWTGITSYDGVVRTLATVGLDVTQVLAAILLIVTLECIEWKVRIDSVPFLYTIRSTVLRWMIYIATLLAIANLGVINETPFIYFQF